jgi:gliding motility-associated-like protein
MVWGSGNTIFGADTGLSKTLRITQDTIIWSSASDTTYCPESDTIHIIVHKQPEVDVGPDVRICSYGQADMKVSYQIDQGAKRSIVWTDIKTNTVVDNDTMLSTTDSGLYMCMVSDTFNCLGYDTIRVIKSPEVIASVLGQIICYGAEAELEADPTGGGNAQYRWYEGSKLLGGARKLKVKPTTTTDYWLKVSETIQGVTCKDSTMVRVRVNPLPVIKINPIDKRCVNGSIISLNNFVTVDGSYKPGGMWSSPSAGLIYGDKFNPIASGVSTPPGWKVRYEYTDPVTGCYNKDSGYVTIYALPKPYAGVDDSICTGATKALIGSPLLPPGTWRGMGVEGSYPNWKFNPDASGIINAGTYNVIYHYTDNNTCENEDTVKITVYKTPIVEAGNPKEFCIDASSLTLLGDPAGGVWAGKGVAGNQFYPSLATPGVHDLTYTYTNVKCIVSDKVKYTVWDLPVVSANTQSGKTYFCRNDGLVQLNGQPGGPGGVWSGPGVSGTTFNPAIGADAITDYSLRYEYTDNHKCKNKADIMVKVKPEPTVVIDPAGKTLCFGNPYTIKANYTHADGVLWWKDPQSDGNIVGNADSSQISYDPGLNDLSKLYFWLHIKTTHSDNICAPAYDSMQVDMSAMPVPEFSGDPQSGCSPLSVQFSDLSTINPGSIAVWEWNFGDGNMDGNQNPMHVYQLPGKYDVRLKVVSDAGCEKDILKSQYIEAYIVPMASFIPKPSLALLSVPTIAFQNRTTNVTSGTEYLWNFDDYKIKPDGGTSTEKDPIYKYSDTGYFHVILTVTNEFGCIDTAMREITILPDVSVYIPNAFTPDGRGPEKNNVFKAVTGGIQSFEIKIYDRWGQLMYESGDYESHGWEGTYLGSTTPAPMAVYVYVVKVKGLDGLDYKYTGSITLLR